MVLPVVAQVAQQVQGGPIGPVQVIHEQHQRPRPGERVEEPRYRFEEPPFGGQLILGGGRQIGVAHAQLRQDARQFGQPQVLQQVLRRVFRLQPRAQGLHQRLIGQPSPQLEGLPAEHLSALGTGPGHELRGQPRFADAGLPDDKHGLRLATARPLQAADELAEGRCPSDERGHERAWRLALRRGRGGSPPARPATASRERANVVRQGEGVRRGLDLQLLGQARPAGGEDLQRSGRIPQRQIDPHEAARGLLLECIERQPAREGDAGLLQLEAFLLPGREPLEEELQAHLPLLLLLLVPLVKRGFLAQPEALEEGAAHQGQGVLELGDQAGALWLRRGRGEPLGRCVSLLHHVQVQFQWSLRVQAEQLMRTVQMAVPARRGVVVSEQAAQQGQGIAQGRARIVGLAVGPQQGGELAAGMQTAFDRQVEQQGLRLAQGKREVAAIMNHCGRAEHGQT
jgi:hypothetical protein